MQRSKNPSTNNVYATLYNTVVKALDHGTRPYSHDIKELAELFEKLIKHDPEGFQKQYRKLSKYIDTIYAILESIADRLPSNPDELSSEVWIMDLKDDLKLAIAVSKNRVLNSCYLNLFFIPFKLRRLDKLSKAMGDDELNVYIIVDKPIEVEFLYDMDEETYVIQQLFGSFLGKLNYMDVRDSSMVAEFFKKYIYELRILRRLVELTRNLIYYDRKEKLSRDIVSFLHEYFSGEYKPVFFEEGDESWIYMEIAEALDVDGVISIPVTSETYSTSRGTYFISQPIGSLFIVLFIPRSGDHGKLCIYDADSDEYSIYEYPYEIPEKVWKAHADTIADLFMKALKHMEEKKENKEILKWIQAWTATAAIMGK